MNSFAALLILIIFFIALIPCCICGVCWCIAFCRGTDDDDEFVQVNSQPPYQGGYINRYLDNLSVNSRNSDDFDQFLAVVSLQYGGGIDNQAFSEARNPPGLLQGVKIIQT